MTTTVRGSKGNRLKQPTIAMVENAVIKRVVLAVATAASMMILLRRGGKAVGSARGGFLLWKKTEKLLE